MALAVLRSNASGFVETYNTKPLILVRRGQGVTSTYLDVSENEGPQDTLSHMAFQGARYIGLSKNRGKTSQLIHFDRVFHDIFTIHFGVALFLVQHPYRIIVYHCCLARTVLLVWLVAVRSCEIHTFKILEDES